MPMLQTQKVVYDQVFEYFKLARKILPFIAMPPCKNISSLTGSIEYSTKGRYEEGRLRRDLRPRKKRDRIHIWALLREERERPWKIVRLPPRTFEAFQEALFSFRNRSSELGRQFEKEQQHVDILFLSACIHSHTAVAVAGP